MIKMMALLFRKPGMSIEDFRDHYETSHVPLVKSLMGEDLIRYVRNYAGAGTPFAVGAEQPGFDCITEFHFADRAGYKRAVAACEHPDHAPAVRADEARFLDMPRIQVSVVDVRERTDGDPF